jgi:hypothetical protein
MEKRTHTRAKIIAFGDYEDSYCEVLDISDGGACIMTKRSYRVGRIAGLRLSPKRVAQVKWVSPAGDGFKIGLKFLV